MISVQVHSTKQASEIDKLAMAAESDESKKFPKEERREIIIGLIANKSKPKANLFMYVAVKNNIC